MARRSAEEQLEILKTGCVELVSEKELLEKLKTGKPLIIKAGFDPTTPDIHLGHTVVINKMRQFQELGHHVVFVVGSFTAMIGDPSGVDKMRPQLSFDVVQKNSKTYAKQAFKILDKKKTEVTYNHKWLGKLKSEEVFHLASQMTVARMLERDDFEKRYKGGKPIGIHEFLYPLSQAYDSYQIKADVELGGTDQKFNLLVGREVQKAYGQKPQAIMTMPLLLGLDGVQKMSKSLDNYIGVDEPSKEIFGKMMRLSDELMWRYYEFLSQFSAEEIQKLKDGVQNSQLHPKEIKKNLASLIVTRYYDEKTAQKEGDEFDRIFKEKKVPTDIKTFKISTKEETVSLISLLVDSSLVSSNGEARRLIQQGGVRVDGEKVSDVYFKVKAQSEVLLQAGKRKFCKIKFG